MRRMYTYTQKKKIMRFRGLAVLISAAVMAIGAFVGLLFFARPDTSDTENRELAKFPSFTVTTFLDGSYFEDVSRWYSDTYPGRDALVSAAQGVKSLFGIGGDTQTVTENATPDGTADENENDEDVTEETTESATEDPEIGIKTSSNWGCLGHYG